MNQSPHFLQLRKRKVQKPSRKDAEQQVGTHAVQLPTLSPSPVQTCSSPTTCEPMVTMVTANTAFNECTASSIHITPTLNRTYDCYRGTENQVVSEEEWPSFTAPSPGLSPSPVTTTTAAAANESTDQADDAYYDPALIPIVPTSPSDEPNAASAAASEFKILTSKGSWPKLALDGYHYIIDKE